MPPDGPRPTVVTVSALSTAATKIGGFYGVRHAHFLHSVPPPGTVLSSLREGRGSSWATRVAHRGRLQMRRWARNRPRLRAIRQLPTTDRNLSRSLTSRRSPVRVRHRPLAVVPWIRWFSAAPATVGPCSAAAWKRLGSHCPLNRSAGLGVWVVDCCCDHGRERWSVEALLPPRNSVPLFQRCCLNRRSKKHQSDRRVTPAGVGRVEQIIMWARPARLALV
jgi:hypothetical protein